MINSDIAKAFNIQSSLQIWKRKSESKDRGAELLTFMQAMCNDHKD